MKVIGAGRLRVLRRTQAFFQAADDANLSVDAVARHVETDPGLALQLIITCNTTHHAHLDHRLTSIDYAVLMLGMARARQICLTMPVLEETAAPEALDALLRVIESACHAAAQARRWAVLRKDMVPGEVYLAALLNNMGEYALWLFGVPEARRIEELITYSALAPDEAQYLVLGFTLEQLAQEMANVWIMPPLVCDGLRAGKATQPRVLGVRLACKLAQTVRRGWYTPETVQCLEQLASYLHRSVEEALVEVHRSAVEAARSLQPLGIVSVVAGLLHPPLRRAVPPVDCLRPDGREAAFCMMPQLHVLREVMGRLTALLDTGVTFDVLMAQIMRGMHDGIGLNRVVFCVLSHERDTLYARYIAGAGNNPAFDQFYLPVTQPHLFTSMMERPMALWINGQNREKYWPRIPQAMKGLIRTDSFFVQSVFRGDKPFGLFYADRHGYGCELDEQSFKQFQVMAQLAGKILERLRYRGKGGAN